MELPLIDVSMLIINRQNDRHGELPDEAAAIAWMLKNNKLHMKNLAQDIAVEGLYEAPLVYPMEKGYLVCDGNRRVTCLRLLFNPQLAPTPGWQKFFKSLFIKYTATIPRIVSCRIEKNLEKIDRILFRIHTGSQKGIGRSPWDSSAKTNFINRTGNNDRINVAVEIEKKLKSLDHLKAGVQIPKSNLQRLLSSEALRNRVGISLTQNSLVFTHIELKVIYALAHIVDDLIKQHIVLGDLWDNAKKRSYLDRLEKMGILPNANDTLSEPVDFTKNDVSASSLKKFYANKKQKRDRNSLIPNKKYRIADQAELERILSIWGELQHNLDFRYHTNSISVLFRVILEFIIDHYGKKMGDYSSNEKLKKRFVKVCDNLLAAGVLEKKYAQNIKKFEHHEGLFSIDTLNQYVHAQDWHPSKDHLCSMWDSLETFILACLEGTCEMNAIRN